MNNENTKWEYKVIDFNPRKNYANDEQAVQNEEGMLNRMGMNGWEFVNIGRMGYVFKRPKN